MWTDNVWAALAVVGLLVITKFFLGVAQWVYTNMIASGNLKKYKAAGNWAVVTGASDGIGKELAKEIAKRGFNVVLVARNAAKLDAVKAEISGVEVMTVVLDFAKATLADYKAVFAKLDKIEIGILVNNVGISYEFPQYFATSDLEYDLELLKVNCESQIVFTKYVAKRLVDKRAGAIINLASLFGIANAPLLSAYSGSKAFNRQFSNSLALELRESKVDVLAVTPGFVATKMAGTKRTNFQIVDAKQMAKQTLNKLGVVTETCGHWHHDLMKAVMEALPASYINGQSLGTSKSLNKKALKKRQEAAAAAKSE
jgi:17beta-estradiol 17-dehydrogenase / very-long-chain 3-oxoacyl-CoA reductase